jgi:putative endonuclease
MFWPFTRRPPKDAEPLAKHLQTGRLAEQAAERFLRKAGHKTVARNVAYRQGEVDLVTIDKRTRTLCFVEVRSRAVPEGKTPEIAPEETVTLRKRRRVISAAKKFLADRHVVDQAVRFDVISVVYAGEDRKRPVIRHFPAAFDSTGIKT